MAKFIILEIKKNLIKKDIDLELIQIQRLLLKPTKNIKKIVLMFLKVCFVIFDKKKNSVF